MERQGSTKSKGGISNSLRRLSSKKDQAQDASIDDTTPKTPVHRAADGSAFGSPVTLQPLELPDAPVPSTRPSSSYGSKGPSRRDLKSTGRSMVERRSSLTPGERLGGDWLDPFLRPRTSAGRSRSSQRVEDEAGNELQDRQASEKNSQEKEHAPPGRTLYGDEVVPLQQGTGGERSNRSRSGSRSGSRGRQGGGKEETSVDPENSEAFKLQKKTSDKFRPATSGGRRSRRVNGRELGEDGLDSKDLEQKSEQLRPSTSGGRRSRRENAGEKGENRPDSKDLEPRPRTSGGRRSKKAAVVGEALEVESEGVRIKKERSLKSNSGRRRVRELPEGAEAPCQPAQVDEISRSLGQNNESSAKEQAIHNWVESTVLELAGRTESDAEEDAIGARSRTASGRSEPGIELRASASHDSRASGSHGSGRDASTTDLRADPPTFRLQTVPPPRSSSMFKARGLGSPSLASSEGVHTLEEGDSESMKGRTRSARGKKLEAGMTISPVRSWVRMKSVGDDSPSGGSGTSDRAPSSRTLAIMDNDSSAGSGHPSGVPMRPRGGTLRPAGNQGQSLLKSPKKVSASLETNSSKGDDAASAVDVPSEGGASSGGKRRASSRKLPYAESGDDHLNVGSKVRSSRKDGGAQLASDSAAGDCRMGSESKALQSQNEGGSSRDRHRASSRKLLYAESGDDLLDVGNKAGTGASNRNGVAQLAPDSGMRDDPSIGSEFKALPSPSRPKASDSLAASRRQKKAKEAALAAAAAEKAASGAAALNGPDWEAREPRIPVVTVASPVVVRRPMTAAPIHSSRSLIWRRSAKQGTDTGHASEATQSGAEAAGPSQAYPRSASTGPVLRWGSSSGKRLGLPDVFVLGGSAGSDEDDSGSEASPTPGDGMPVSGELQGTGLLVQSAQAQWSKGNPERMKMEEEVDRQWEEGGDEEAQAQAEAHQHAPQSEQAQQLDGSIGPWMSLDMEGSGRLDHGNAPDEPWSLQTKSSGGARKIEWQENESLWVRQMDASQKLQQLQQKLEMQQKQCMDLRGTEKQLRDENERLREQLKAEQDKSARLEAELARLLAEKERRSASKKERAEREKEKQRRRAEKDQLAAEVAALKLPSLKLADSTSEELPPSPLVNGDRGNSHNRNSSPAKSSLTTRGIASKTPERSRFEKEARGEGRGLPPMPGATITIPGTLRMATPERPRPGTPPGMQARLTRKNREVIRAGRRESLTSCGSPGVGKDAFGVPELIGIDGPANILGRPFVSVRDIYKVRPEELGRGRFGVIRACFHRSTGQQYACKTISKSMLTCEQDVEDVRREVAVMELLEGHPHVASLKAVFEDELEVHLVMELCEGGELFDRIKTKVRYDEPDAAVVIFTVVNVLQHCHNLGVMHRDLKPENILLVSRDSDTDLKVIDYGVATFFHKGQHCTDMAGSPYYLAPEVLAEKYGPEADIWSTGVVLYILLSGLPPFWAQTNEGIFKAIQEGTLNMVRPPWPDISDEAKDLVQKMLTREPERRIGLQSILAHPWIMRYNPP